MRFHPTGLVAAAVFYGLVWYAFGSGLDYSLMRALAVAALSVAAGWLSVGFIADSPLAPLKGLRTRRGRTDAGKKNG
jgi:hypothetical protein